MIRARCRNHFFRSWKQNDKLNSILVREHSEASEYIRCSKCERLCPQHLPIEKLMAQMAGELENCVPQPNNMPTADPFQGTAAVIFGVLVLDCPVSACMHRRVRACTGLVMCLRQDSETGSVF